MYGRTAKKELDIIIPISLEEDWPTKESVTGDIRALNRRWGFDRFALFCPGKGWRSAVF